MIYVSKENKWVWVWVYILITLPVYLINDWLTYSLPHYSVHDINDYYNWKIPSCSHDIESQQLDSIKKNQ